MAKIGLYYGSNEGHTEYVADIIKEKFDAYEEGLIQVHNIAEADLERMAQWDYLILGIPTWNIGELQDDWEAIFPELDSLDLSGTRVAIYGLGDQYGYSDTFLDAVGMLADKVLDLGGELYGLWPNSGYEFTGSLAQQGEWFLGLAIDEDNETNRTEKRVEEWVRQLMHEFELRPVKELYPEPA